jgi:hypothetical protein
VEQGIHRHGLRANDLRSRGDPKDPSQEVPPASEETTDASIATCGNRCPVVDYAIRQLQCRIRLYSFICVVHIGYVVGRLRGSSRPAERDGRGTGGTRKFSREAKRKQTNIKETNSQYAPPPDDGMAEASSASEAATSQ